MYKRILRKRILKGTVIALALFAVIPVTNAAARPLTDGVNTRPVGLHQTPIGPTAAERRADILRGQGMNQKYQVGPTAAELQAMNARGNGMNKKYHLGQYAQTGGSDINWQNSGIGAGLFVALLLGTAGVLVVRNRRHGTLAH